MRFKATFTHVRAKGPNGINGVVFTAGSWSEATLKATAMESTDTGLTLIYIERME